jgi:two-component system KDP operon response regulator KdpE
LEPLILIIEDDLPIRKFLRAALTTQGYRLQEAGSVKEGNRLAASYLPDIVLLDLGLPDGDGIEVIRSIRSWSRLPIIVISIRGRDQDKIQALDEGADDYLTKPFSAGELLARIRVALRHAAGQGEQKQNPQPLFQVRELYFDPEARCLTLAGREIHLTPIEYKLFSVLAKNAGKVLTHNFLVKEVWGPANVYQSQNLRVLMAGLRRKIEARPAEPEYLQTEVGIGYRLLDE